MRSIAREREIESDKKKEQIELKSPNTIFIIKRVFDGGI